MSTQTKSIVVDLNELDLDLKTFQKMVFVFNAIEDGWNVKKREGRYIFQKHHEGKKEVYEESYLEEFIRTHMEIKK